MTRFGMGYDVHRLVKDRDMIIGGVKIEHSLGLLGHSDADVLLHAIADALLGAASLGDSGFAGAFISRRRCYRDCEGARSTR